jgi:hypothetical protein
MSGRPRPAPASWRPRTCARADLPALAAAGRVAVEDMDRARGSRGGTGALPPPQPPPVGRGPPPPHGPPPPRALAHRAPRPEEPHAAAATAALEPPDDALLSAVLVKLFADRQIAVAPALVAYLVPRIDRSFAAAHAIVDRLDRAALSEGRPVTRSLAARLLDNATGGEA